MAIREIVRGTSFLRKKSREVVVFDSRLRILLGDMADTMAEAMGIGLAAVQVGVLRRVVVVDTGTVDESNVVELINPVIIEASEETQNEAEGCLSFPNEYGMVERPAKVKVQAQDRHGDLFTIEGEGLIARAICHEIDHLNGVLYIDLATEMLEPNEGDK